MSSPPRDSPRRVIIERRTIWSWVAVIVAAVIGFWVSRGTDYQQFAMGMLVSAVTLLILLLAVEILWQMFEAGVDPGRGDAGDRDRRR